MYTRRQSRSVRRQPSPPGKAARTADPGQPPKGPLECTVRRAVTGTQLPVRRRLPAACSLGTAGPLSWNVQHAGAHAGPWGREETQAAGPGGDPIPGLVRPQERVTLLSPALSSHGTPQAARPSVSALAEGDHIITAPSQPLGMEAGSRADARQVWVVCKPLSQMLCANLSLSLAPNASSY